MLCLPLALIRDCPPLGNLRCLTPPPLSCDWLRYLRKRKAIDILAFAIMIAVCDWLGRPVCRTKLPRKVFNFKTKNGPKNAPKLSRKILSLVLLCRISHGHYSKIFHCEFPHKIKYFFTPRICRHGHANDWASVWDQVGRPYYYYGTVVWVFHWSCHMTCVCVRVGLETLMHTWVGDRVSVGCDAVCVYACGVWSLCLRAAWGMVAKVAFQSR